ncbi:MAG: bacterial Ig-like domain-containing protein [Oscillospiraceae bacterium]|nr:bacterial Ig-like domain-containing protein [Oscillospiraceae bacterium]
MKRNQNNNISFGDYDNKGSRKLLPLLLTVLILLAVAAGGYFGYKFVSARRNAVVSIEVTSPPAKYIYWVGQDIDYTGLEVIATRKNGKTFAVDLNDCEINGFISEYAIEKLILTVKYAGFSDLFSVEVREKPTATPILKGISIVKMPKTVYKVGERLNTDGGVMLVEYTNALPKRINIIKDIVSGYSKDYPPGTYTLTVTYTDREINQVATTTYTITVTE